MIKPHLFKPLLVVSLFIALSTACKRSSNDQPTLVPTLDTHAHITPGLTVIAPDTAPTPTQTAWQPVSPTPTAVPATPTPTPLPNVQLGLAKGHIANGDYAAAQAIYRSLPFDTLTSEQAVQDYLGFASSLRYTHDLDQAKDVLYEMLDRFPDHPRVPEAHFMLAEILVESGEHLAAINEYQAYLDWHNAQGAPSPIAAYTQRWIGDAYLNAGEYTQAIDVYQQALNLAPTTEFTLLTREKLALTYNYAAERDSALTQLDLILAITQDDYWRARIQYQAAQTLLAAENREAAYQRYYDLIANYPDSSYAYDALVDLINNQQPVGEFQRGLVDYYADAYDPAIAAFYRVIQADPDGHDGAPHYYAALTYRNAGNYQAAIQELDELINDHPDRYWDDAWLAKAWTYYLADNDNAAVQTYTQFVAENSDNGLAPEALWWAANIHYWNDSNQAAAELFEQLQADYPSNEYAPDALYRAGVCRYRLGDYIKAANDWEQYTTSYPYADFISGAHFWQGRAYLDVSQTLTSTAILSGSQIILTTSLPLSDTQNPITANITLLSSSDFSAWASAAFNAAIASDPLDYYSLRAADYIAGGRAPVQRVPYNLSYDESSERLQTEEWLVTWLGLSAQDVGQLSPALNADGRLLRGQELWRLGRFDQARDELETLRRATATDALTQYQLAIFFRDLGLYRSSILCANAVIRLSPARSPLDAPAFLARLAYPTYYSELVIPEAEANDLDPLLVFALIRQESLFEGFATSYAYAHGLMQIIPSTGQGIANNLGWPDYHTNDLYLPYISVKFGAWYLAQQANTFDGEMYAAMAAYNAGPGNSRRWLDRTLADCQQDECVLDYDLFVELMHLREPRLYIRLISEHLAVYQRLYGR